MLLRKQFPDINSLQSVSLGQVMNFKMQNGAFLQILHSSDNHWLTIVGTGGQYPSVRVYDSLYSSTLSMVKAQIACLLCTKENKFQVDIMDVKAQVQNISNS